MNYGDIVFIQCPSARCIPGFKGSENLIKSGVGVANTCVNKRVSRSKNF